MKTLVIIPCYNEEENILAVVRRLQDTCPEADYLVVNDCSTDRSREILSAAGCRYLDLPVNLGIGGAVQSGYRYAMENGYDVTVQMDGDGQHDPAYLAAVVAPVADGTLDMAIGSRFITHEGFQTSFMRRLGINYAIAPNCGIGFPITSDEGVYNFLDSMRTQPFVLAMQGEGREWSTTFSKEAREQFDYVFTDALTFTDRKGRRVRLWIAPEVVIDNNDQEAYMDLIVEKTCDVLKEPADIFVNPFFLPECMNDRYEQFWTDARVDKVIRELVKNGKALEINELYRIPSQRIIMKAKEAGVKFTFGSNNVSPEVGKLEYALQMKKACGITAEEMYVPRIK